MIFEDIFKYSSDVNPSQDYHISKNPIDGQHSSNNDKLINKIKFFIVFYNNDVLGDVANH